MISMYKWYQVKALQGKGLTIKKIMKELKLSKNAVRKYMRSNDPPEFKKRHYDKELNRYDSEIKEMIGKEYFGTRILKFNKHFHPKLIA